MKRILMAAMILSAALSCNRKDVDVISEGSLSINVLQSEEGFNIVTKANDVLDEFVIDIVRQDNWAESFVFGDIKGDMIKLGSGDYTITAHSPENGHAVWDLPYYSASQDFTIKPGEVTPINLVCELQNVKVTIVLSENFKQELSTYNVVVSNGRGKLTWEKTADGKDDFSAEKAGYFSVAPLEVIVNGHRAIDNTSASTTMSITDVAAKDHHIINIDAKVTGQIGTDTDGDGIPDSGISVSIDNKVTPKDEDVYVDGLEEIPVQGGDDDPDDDNTGDDDGGDNGEGEPTVPSTLPAVVWVGNESYAEQTITDGMSVDLEITAPLGIKTFVIDVDSEVLSMALPSMTSDGSCTLDLIGDTKLINFFNSTPGLDVIPTGDRLSGKGIDAPVSLSIGNLIGLISGLNPESGSKHVFTVKMTDMQGQENPEPRSLVFVSE